MEYTEILPNWMNYEELYKKAVDSIAINQTANFLELGTFKGRSAAYMGQCIKESGKKISFTTIDIFDSTQDNDHAAAMIENMFQVVLDNIQKCGVREFVNVQKCSTKNFAALTKDQYDFIFIDASHTYEGVKRDIQDYRKLLKPGGTLAGHDYNLPAVKKAVDENFSFNVLKFYQNCWIYKSSK